MKSFSAAFLVVFAVSSANVFAAPAKMKPAKPNIHSVQYRQPSKVTQNFCNAATNSNLDVMKLFLEQGAEIDNENCDRGFSGGVDVTPLMESIGIPLLVDTNTKVFKFLLANGANPNYQTKYGETPLMILVGKNLEDSTLARISELFEAGSKVDIESVLGYTALDYAISADHISPAASERSLKIMDYLIHTKGANVNHKNKAGETPLMLAAKLCEDDKVKLLISSGADARLITPKGNTALIFAADSAAQQSSNGPCNSVVKILQNPNDSMKSDLAVTPKVSTATAAQLPSPLSFIDTLKKFEKNKTTYGEVIRELGEPISKSISTDSGEKSIYYGGKSAPYNTVSSVPVEVLFGAKTSMQEVYVAVIIFDQNDLLIGINAKKLGSK